MKRLLFNQLDEKGNAIRGLSAIGGADAIIKIGTHPQCKIRLEDSFVMSLHATIEPLDGAPLLRFCGGDPERCGLNGRMAKNDCTYPIHVGDRILVGKTVLQLVGIGEAEDDRGLDELSEVLERAAAFLGFKTDGSPSGTAKAFAHWLAFAEAFVMSPDGQHQATWTEVMMRAIGTRGMMAARSEASEAADVADAALKELVKRFPPRMQHVESCDEWSSSEAEEAGAVVFMSEQIAKWRGATGCETPEEAGEKRNGYEADTATLANEITALRMKDAAWKEATSVETPEETIQLRKKYERSLDEIMKDRDLWRSNFCDAERLLLSIREALGLPKESYADVLSVASGQRLSIEQLTKKCREASEDGRKAEDAVDRIREAFGMASVDRICEIAKTALVPLPKPERVEAGQKWAHIRETTLMPHVDGPKVVGLGLLHGHEVSAIERAEFVYLGKA